MQIITDFQNKPFIEALKGFFSGLQVPVNYIADEPFALNDLLGELHNPDNTFQQLLQEVYVLGIVNDAIFGNEHEMGSLDEVKALDKDYDGLLILGAKVERQDGRQPSRNQLANLTRLLNRAFPHMPVVVVFSYDHHLAFANAERVKYTHVWREEEKVGKVSLLRDIDTQHLHAGHQRILLDLKIDSKKVDSFSKLYTYWQEVFSVSVLNKKFYKELSDWYFWAIKNVTYPGQPTAEDAHAKGKELKELIQEHKATNVIRLLTRLLFTWFIKEKKLIPEQLFDLDALQKDILNDISPYHETGLLKERNRDSVYYKAILQNLFFATLNCPIEADALDTRVRGFRGESYGANRGVDWLMRYKGYFKDPDKFLAMMNATVPFLNGGLFECLDDKSQNIYIDGFSDGMTKGEQLIVPDYLFFGLEEQVDLSEEYGISSKGTKQAAVKGLINILKSYKFTITENTPIEEDVALDPELLGKVFENLLASYNPETKTTARKQTGSFYTPREIVNYMVDESLIAYLKTKIKNEEASFVELGKVQTNLFGNEGVRGQQSLQVDVNGSELKEDEDRLDALLHELVSYNTGNPLADYPNTTKIILRHLSECKILDPACGSGAFPMGILQKMVHVLHKLDPDNTVWKEVQRARIQKELDEVLDIEDKAARQERLNEINEAFDQSMNDPDYARKLYLIENCIYGVDIQPIATQISKLRFFISLVVEQKVRADKKNFGIRPLPNLETKFVTANTLIGIEKPTTQTSLLDTPELKRLESELRAVRHRLFSARDKKTKIKYREQDESLRNQIAHELIENGWNSDSALKLAAWDPYDQNASSFFFDPEWMFGHTAGFDVVIGNPPYIEFKKLSAEEKKPYLKYKSATGKFDIYVIFLEKGINLTSQNTGILCYINPTTFMRKDFGGGIRLFLKDKTTLLKIQDFVDIQVFEGATNYTGVFLIQNSISNDYSFQYSKYECPKHISSREFELELRSLSNSIVKNIQFLKPQDLKSSWEFINPKMRLILDLCDNESIKLKDCTHSIFQGIASGKDEVFYVGKEEVEEHSFEPEILKPILKGKDIKAYEIDWSGTYVIYPYDSSGKVIKESDLSHRFPYAYTYFNRKKHLLVGRSYFDKSTKLWYEIWNQRNPKNFGKNRIVTTEISSKNNFILTKDFFGNTKTYHILLKNEFNEFYVLGLLNSRLLEFYYHNITTPQAGGFYAYKTQFLNNIPIRINPIFIILISALSNLLTFDNSSRKKDIMVIMDALVFNLYFPDHMKERKIDVLECVERDMANALQGRDFDSLSDAEKERVIAQLHTTWTDPNNEVVKRMGQFREKSPDILGVILDS